ncbi:MAG: hypothetical protein QG585_477 [Patescibacteria group bacterium]|jgi:predicted PurR-regulated permease PerM|nr:hypothetical protein [Patescibacteria group bacterium]
MRENDREIIISTSTILKAIILIVVVFGLYYLRDLVLTVLTAIVLASAIDPGVRWFERRKMPRLVGVVFIYSAVAMVVAALFLSVIPIILEDMSSVIESIPTYISQINNIIPLLDESILQGYVPLLQELSNAVANKTFLTELGNTGGNTGGFFSTASAIATSLINLILVFVLAFYFSVTKDGIENFLRLVTPIKHEKYVSSLWARTKEKIGAWMQGQLLLGVVVGFLVYAVLAVFKVEHALILGILAAFFELIPVFGPVLSAIPGIGLTLLDQGIGLAIIIAFWYIIVQQLENHLLYPAVVKKIVGISPLLVILALVVGVKLAGITGAILAVPVSVLLMEFLDDVDRKKSQMRKSE